MQYIELLCVCLLFTVSALDHLTRFVLTTDHTSQVTVYSLKLYYYICFIKSEYIFGLLTDKSVVYHKQEAQKRLEATSFVDISDMNNSYKFPTEMSKRSLTVMRKQRVKWEPTTNAPTSNKTPS